MLNLLWHAAHRINTFSKPVNGKFSMPLSASKSFYKFKHKVHRQAWSLPLQQHDRCAWACRHTSNSADPEALDSFLASVLASVGKSSDFREPVILLLGGGSIGLVESPVMKLGAEYRCRVWSTSTIAVLGNSMGHLLCRYHPP